MKCRNCGLPLKRESEIQSPQAKGIWWHLDGNTVWCGKAELAVKERGQVSDDRRAEPEEEP